MPYPHDLENDLEHTIPPEGGQDSQWLFFEMTRLALDTMAPQPGERILDLACGMGQDTRALAEMQRAAQSAGQATTRRRGVTVGLEPSQRMIRFGQTVARGEAGPGMNESRIEWVRGFGESLPFRDSSFDGVLCKGAMDHFLSPAGAMAEIARVLKPGGRLVLALANYDSLSCRLGRWRSDRLEEPGAYQIGAPPYYEPPPDHLARFGYRDVLALMNAPLRLAQVRGISMLWLFPPWSALVARAPRPVASLLLALAFALGRALPSQADVTLVRARRD